MHLPANTFNDFSLLSYSYYPGHLSNEYNLIHMKDTKLDKNTVAIDALAEEMAKNMAIAEFVEVKANTGE